MEQFEQKLMAAKNDEDKRNVILEYAKERFDNRNNPESTLEGFIAEAEFCAWIIDEASKD